MNVKEALVFGIKQLKTQKIISANLDAELILMYTLKEPKEFIFSYPEKILTPTQQFFFENNIKARGKYIPVAQLLGIKEFFGLLLYVNKNVLVPRPETELLVEETLKLIKEKYNKTATVADIGTGSGAIAVALAKNLPQATILATEKSIKALTVAKKNAQQQKTKIFFYKGDLLEPIKNKKIDIITTNLPYLETALKNKLTKIENKGLKFEPAIALYSGKDGLDAYKKLFRQISKLTYTPKYILLEAGPKQFKKIGKLILQLFPQAKITLKKDFACQDRILIWEN